MKKTGAGQAPSQQLNLEDIQRRIEQIQGLLKQVQGGETQEIQEEVVVEEQPQEIQIVQEIVQEQEEQADPLFDFKTKLKIFRGWKKLSADKTRRQRKEIALRKYLLKNQLSDFISRRPLPVCLPPPLPQIIRPIHRTYLPLSDPSPLIHPSVKIRPAYQHRIRPVSNHIHPIISSLDESTICDSRLMHQSPAVLRNTVFSPLRNRGFSPVPRIKQQIYRSKGFRSKSPRNSAYWQGFDPFYYDYLQERKERQVRRKAWVPDRGRSPRRHFSIDDSFETIADSYLQHEEDPRWGMRGQNERLRKENAKLRDRIKGSRRKEVL